MITISTHILDTTNGKPASGVSIALSVRRNNSWVEIGSGATNDDGRIPGLVSSDIRLDAGVYRLRFETKNYFEKNDTPSFFPYIEIIFDVQPDQRYHVPLLLNPYGYSTYRGS